MTYTSKYLTPLGGVTLAGEGEVLTGLWFDGQKYFGNGLPVEHEAGELPVFGETRRWLEIYFSGAEPDFTPPLGPRGSPFRMEVWDILRGIPFGSTVTYGEIAARMAARRGLRGMSAQAVGGAVGHNPISIIIPCHRVLGADGALTGYAGGLERKAALLALESAAR